MKLIVARIDLQPEIRTELDKSWEETSFRARDVRPEHFKPEVQRVIALCDRVVYYDCHVAVYTLKSSGLEPPLDDVP